MYKYSTQSHIFQFPSSSLSEPLCLLPCPSHASVRRSPFTQENLASRLSIQGCLPLFRPFPLPLASQQLAERAVLFLTFVPLPGLFPLPDSPLDGLCQLSSVPVAPLQQVCSERLSVLGHSLGQVTGRPAQGQGSGAPSAQSHCRCLVGPPGLDVPNIDSQRPRPNCQPKASSAPFCTVCSKRATQLALGSLVLFQLGLDSPHQSTSP